MTPSPPVSPIRDDEWTPARERDAELAALPTDVDDLVLRYPLRRVVGRLLSRGPRGAAGSAQVGWSDGSVTSYSGYLRENGGVTDRVVVESKAAAALRAARQSGCVFAAVGRVSGSDLVPLRHEPAEAGAVRGLAVDFALSPLVTVFSSSLIVVEGQYLVHSLTMRQIPLPAVDDGWPGVLVAASLHDAGGWAWAEA